MILVLRYSCDGNSARIMSSIKQIEEDFGLEWDKMTPKPIKNMDMNTNFGSELGYTDSDSGDFYIFLKVESQKTLHIRPKQTVIKYELEEEQ
jgi:hypothetical protein